MVSELENLIVQIFKEKKAMRKKWLKRHLLLAYKIKVSDYKLNKILNKLEEKTIVAKEGRVYVYKGY